MSDNENPYQQPQSELIANSGASGELLSTPNSRAIGDGWRWIADGFSLFKMAPGTWIGAGILCLILFFVMAFIPIIGGIAAMLLMPVFLAGFMLGCESLNNGDGMEIGVIFAGFKQNTGQLVLVGVIYFILYIIAFIPLLLIAGSSFFAMMTASADPEAIQDVTFGASFFIGILISMALYVPVVMTYWFAPALVSLNNMSAVEAMKMSFSGCLKNIMPFLWYGIIAIILYFLSIIPLGLGLLVFLPTVIASVYTGYRSIFINAD